MSYERTLQDVSEIIIQAKHKETDVLPITQVFYYPSKAELSEFTDSMKLIDLDDTFLQMLEDGEELVFKGDEREKLVLCTDESTFEVKEGEISNCLIISSNMVSLGQIKAERSLNRQLAVTKINGIFHDYLELRPTFPRVNKLREILAQSTIETEEGWPEGYYIGELKETVQCSRQELLKELHHLRAICINDGWSLLSNEHESHMLSLLINLMEEKSWKTIPQDKAQSILSSVIPEVIFEHLVQHFTEPSSGNDQAAGSLADIHHTYGTHMLLGNELQLLEGPVARCFATVLLSAGEGRFRHNEFIMAWKHFLPKGMKTDLSHLRGMALLEKQGSQQDTVVCFPEHSLPENVAERFRLLFKKRSKWTYDEIEPYISLFNNN